VVGGVTFVLGGCDVLLDDMCASVDFGGQRRALSYTCYANEGSGEMSGPVAGALMFFGGVALIMLACWPVIQSVRENRRYRHAFGTHSGRSSEAEFDAQIAAASDLEAARQAGREAAARTNERLRAARVAMSIAAVLKHVAAQEGVGTAGWESAKRILVIASDGALSLEDAHLYLLSADYTDLEPACVPDELKWLLIRSTMEIAVADGVLTNDEEAAIVRVIRDLWGCSQEEALGRLAAVIQVLTSDHDPQKAEALKVLGLDEHATTADIREAYLKLVRQHHPDLVSADRKDDATTKTAEFNTAYEYLVGARTT